MGPNMGSPGLLIINEAFAKKIDETTGSLGHLEGNIARLIAIPRCKEFNRTAI